MYYLTAIKHYSNALHNCSVLYRDSRASINAPLYLHLKTGQLSCLHLIGQILNVHCFLVSPVLKGYDDHLLNVSCLNDCCVTSWFLYDVMIVVWRHDCCVTSWLLCEHDYCVTSIFRNHVVRRATQVVKKVIKICISKML